jgi:ppGpp synthetase/RelA/SpoT-type nucleotidyltranferase
MIGEIQIRSKLQDAWSDFTHAMYIEVPTEFQENYKATIADIASRLSAEDNSALAVRDILQEQAKKKEVDDFTKN